MDFDMMEFLNGGPGAMIWVVLSLFLPLAAGLSLGYWTYYDGKCRGRRRPVLTAVFCGVLWPLALAYALVTGWKKPPSEAPAALVLNRRVNGILFVIMAVACAVFAAVALLRFLL